MDMDSILKRAQEFQYLMSKKQEELAGRTVTSTVGGGMVTVIVSGKFEIVSLQIEKAAINPDEAEMLQDLVVAAVNDAMSRAKAMVNEEMGKLTKGISIPGLPNLF